MFKLEWHRNGGVVTTFRFVGQSVAIKIDIWYRLRDADSDGHLSLTPEAYFGPVDPHETYEQNGIPRFNFTWQYLDVPRDRLLWSIERRAGTEDDT
ncbi:MAG: hypothetical protein AB8G99_27380, partial [Planctomycetaceae bacterium]